MESLLNWTGQRPELRRPVLLVALDGFVDAGHVGENAVVFLRHRWRAEKVAEFDADAFVDYRARRPTVVVDGGRLRRVEWPRIELFAAELAGDRDALILVGPEPDMRWHAFTDTVEQLCRAMDVSRVVTLGAYPAATPHTRPVSVVQAGNEADESPLDGPRPVISYTGPVGAATALQGALGDRGVASVGLWAEVPHYIAASPNPPGVLRMVEIVSSLLGVVVDTGELQAAAKLHREQVDEAVAEHGEALEMVLGLEQLTDAGTTDGDLPSGDDIANEIERFLRSQE